MSNLETSEVDSVAAESDRMVSVSAIPLYIMEHSVKTVLDNGVEKHISHTDFLEAFSKHVERGGSAQTESLSLPSNVFSLSKDAVKLTLSCYYKSKISRVLFARNNGDAAVPMDMVMPNIIISHTLSRTGADWVVADTRYMCTDLAVNGLPNAFLEGPAPAKRVYLFPMSNTYDSGTMCYGHNSMPKRFGGGNLRGLDWYYQYLFESPFNSDLGIRALSTEMRVVDWYNLLKKHADENTPFPYDKLHGYAPLNTP